MTRESRAITCALFNTVLTCSLWAHISLYMSAEFHFLLIFSFLQNNSLLSVLENMLQHIP